MERTAIKKRTAFRFDTELLNLLKAKAKEEHRSLNQYVECVLMDAIYNTPNEETLAALEEAKAGKYAGTGGFLEIMRIEK
ncbi:MAG: toxin-antitoxin system protein [Mediterranea sp.]|nr:toxin-antitoxin system protein [Mediterranea sp.]